MTRAFDLPRVLFLTLASVMGLLTLAGLSLPPQALALLLISLVTVMGLPHGAADPWVARTAGMWNRPLGLILFLTAYLSLVGTSYLFWRTTPFPALGLFLFISWVHFSGDWQETFSLPLRLSLSGCILTGPTLLYADRVGEIFSAITFGAPEVDGLVQFLGYLGPVLFGGALWGTTRARVRIGVRSELMGLMAAAILLPPLLFFIAYFCGLHSPRHLQHLADDLKDRIPAQGIAAVTLCTLPLALMAFLALPAQVPNVARLQTVVFGGLFALTLPHMLLVEWRQWNRQTAAPSLSEPQTNPIT